MHIYDLMVLDSDKKPVPMETYRGKVLLIVNTATGCGYTPQYAGLQELYSTYQKQGLEILDFPCNQFLGQAPGTEKEIVHFCATTYGVTFKTFAKINVNGRHADPLFTYLKDAAPNQQSPCPLKRVFKKFVCPSNKVKWNFTKFLVDRQGNVVQRYEPAIKPVDIVPDIERLLQQNV